ncbi:MAG: 2OG-Fe(II) oxygenase [Gammaproteobacteria bacterium]|nr:2OG-Fe(II) oxygenase [Gammaproteobacteria bacterium]
MPKKTYFNSEWKRWIKTNVDAGQDKDGIFKILLDEGYQYSAIKRVMKYEPKVPVSQLINPFHATGQQQRQDSLQDNSGAKISPEKLFIPNAQRLDTDKAEFYTLHNFLNADECCQIIELINQKKQPSQLSSYEADQSFRTSSTCHLGHIDNAFMQDIDQRICRMLGIHSDYSEVIQGQYYEIGQEFKPHTDYFEAHEFGNHGASQGQRTYTFMIYLNTVEEGGETVFPKLGEAFKPEPGMAVIWNSLNPDGTTNGNTLHHATAVKKGYKAVITKWFRSKPNTNKSVNMYTKETNEYIHNYTREGISKLQFPEPVFKQIRAFYQLHQSQETIEHIPGDFVFNQKNNASCSNLIELSDDLRQTIHDTMKPIMEHWCGAELEPTYVYGIRVYKEHAVLKQHRDRLETHIISAIINVDQDVDDDWPLVIDDNSYRQHHVMLKPGDMVLYESGRLKHGRPFALKGRRYANIFCHFKPVDYVPPKF